MSLTLAELAVRIGAELVGDPDIRVTQVVTLEKAGPGDLSFVSNPRYRKHLAGARASAVILTRADADASPVPVLIMDNPYLGYARASAALNPPPPVQGGIHPSAVVSDQARIHPDAWIGPQVTVEAGADVASGAFIGPGSVVGEEVSIGPDTRLVGNVTLCHGVTLGSRVLLHPGVVIGADGFGLANDGGAWVKIPQLGAVVIGDDVEIGANTTVDRGALEDTVIDKGVKLDNQIQVAHNVFIGADTAIAGCVGIAGSVRIGKRCTIGGGVGVSGHLEIVDDVHITGASVVLQSVTEPGVYSSGTPLQPNRTWRRNFSRCRQLDEMMKRIKALEKISGKD